MCMYIAIHVYIRSYIYVHVYIRSYIYVHVYIQLYTCIYMKQGKAVCPKLTLERAALEWDSNPQLLGF